LRRHERQRQGFLHGGGACPLRPVKSFFFDRHGNVPRQRVRPPAHAFCFLQ
jgi:hypothetical protein